MSETLLKLASALSTGNPSVTSVSIEQLNTLQFWGIEGLVHGSPSALSLPATRQRAHAMALLSEDERKRIIEVASIAVDALIAHGVEVIAFKGLSAERYYRSPVYRSYGDADLYIADPAQGDLQAGLQAVGLGKEETAHTISLARARRLSGFTLFEKNIGLDFHFIPTSQFFASNPGAPDVIGKESLLSLPRALAPCPEFDLLIAAVNSVRDSGRSLKAAFDVVAIVRDPSVRLDWDRFDRLARHYEMQAVARPAIATISKQLEIPLNHDGGVEPLRRFDLLSTSAGRLGFKRSNLLNLHYGPSRGAALAAAARWLVPSAGRLQAEGLVFGDAKPTSRFQLVKDRSRRLLSR